MNLLGLDIGGTKTSVSVGTAGGAIRVARRFSSTVDRTQAAYFLRLQATCREVLAEAGIKPTQIAAIGISAPGPLDVRRGILIAPPNNPGWHNVPFKANVQRWFKAPVFLQHDGKASALAEWHFGEFKGTANLVYLTCSTGMGAGIILNGQVVQGPTDSAGEVGHHILDPAGPLCACGMRGCWEAYVGGRTLAERIKARIAKEKITTAIVSKAGGKIADITAVHLEQAARDGDPFAVTVWEEYTERLAQGIGNIIMILNPEVVILGTIAIHAGDFLLRPVRAKLKKYVWKWPLKACTIAPSSIGRQIGDLSALAVAVSGLRAAGGSAAPARKRKRA